MSEGRKVSLTLADMIYVLCFCELIQGNSVHNNALAAVANNALAAKLTKKFGFVWTDVRWELDQRSRYPK